MVHSHQPPASSKRLAFASNGRAIGKNAIPISPPPDSTVLGSMPSPASTSDAPPGCLQPRKGSLFAEGFDRFEEGWADRGTRDGYPDRL